MELSYILGLSAGLGYAVAAIFSKRALQLGCGALRLSFIINWVFVPIFGLLLLSGDGTLPQGAALVAPVVTGLLFFLGQILTFAAIRAGDVSLHTPIMGMKAVFVVLLAAFLGTEPVTPALWAVPLIVGYRCSR